MQIDTGAADKTRYCYAAFTFDGHDNYSRAALDRGVTNPGDRTAPGPVTGLTVATNANGQIFLSWHNPQRAGITFDAVRRAVSPKCPTGPADGSPVGNESVRSAQVDASAKPGVTYCYRVFSRFVRTHCRPGSRRRGRSGASEGDGAAHRVEGVSEKLVVPR